MKPAYFINPVIDRLAEAPPEERPALVRRIAACVGDEAALRGILGIDPEEFAKFYPDMLSPELTTDETISSFMALFDKGSKAKEKEPKEEKPEEELPLPIAPAIDYAAMMMAPADGGEETPADETSDLISSFLASVPPKTPKTPKAPAKEQKSAPEPDLQEELFKMMVKNKNYTKALEIITEISLNNPKKSVYFADQMRFLKKLIKTQAL